MNYKQAIDYIHSTPKFSRVLGNELLRKLLKNLGNPEKDLKYVHIAGTNGKGSIAAMISNILTSAGYKTGLFTSPYIERFNERIRVSGECIPDNELADIVTEIRRTIEKYECEVSEFALDLAAALVYFKKCDCDIVILEVGLGGRLDATNIIEKSLSVITSVSLDHTEYLGNTIEEIAREKAEIIKPGFHTVLYRQNKNEVYDIVKNKCLNVNSKLHISEEPKISSPGVLCYNNTKIPLPLHGEYQYYNAMTAIKAIEILQSEGYTIPIKSISDGIANVIWPVRFEYLSEHLIADGAHNPDAIEKLCKALKGLSSEIIPVIGMMRDKAAEECADIISHYFDSAIATEIDMPRCLPCSELRDILISKGIRAACQKNPHDAVELALNSNKTVCVFGSLYLAGEIRKNFKK